MKRSEAVLKKLEKLSGKLLYQSFVFNKVADRSLQPFKKGTLAQVCSGEFSEIFKNIYFEEHPQTAAS